eukprot:s1177_g12.t1
MEVTHDSTTLRAAVRTWRFRTTLVWPGGDLDAERLSGHEAGEGIWKMVQNGSAWVSDWLRATFGTLSGIICGLAPWLHFLLKFMIPFGLRGKHLKFRQDT